MKRLSTIKLRSNIRKFYAASVYSMYVFIRGIFIYIYLYLIIVIIIMNTDNYSNIHVVKK